jgi:hypothetical protein
MIEFLPFSLCSFISALKAEQWISYNYVYVLVLGNVLTGTTVKISLQQYYVIVRCLRNETVNFRGRLRLQLQEKYKVTTAQYLFDKTSLCSRELSSKMLSK